MHHPSVHDTSCMVVSWLVLCTHKDMNGLSLAFSTLSRWIAFDMRSTPASLHCTVTGSRNRNQPNTLVPCTSTCRYRYVYCNYGSTNYSVCNVHSVCCNSGSTDYSVCRTFTVIVGLQITLCAQRLLQYWVYRLRCVQCAQRLL
jgi:hypothetical protein